MTSTVLLPRLRIKELEGRIFARKQLAQQAPERSWHLEYVKLYEAEIQQLQATLRSKPRDSDGRNRNDPVESHSFR
jgi:hypothetical protein